MNHTQALEFLKAHQPLTDEAIYDQATLDRVGQVVEFYRDNPIAADLPLLFGFIGETDAAGWFDDLEVALVLDFPRSDLIVHVIEALNTYPPDSGVCLWLAMVVRQLQPHESMAVCRAAYRHSGVHTRRSLASEIERAATPADATWLGSLVSWESDEEAQSHLTRALKRIC